MELLRTYKYNIKIVISKIKEENKTDSSYYLEGRPPKRWQENLKVD